MKLAFLVFSVLLACSSKTALPSKKYIIMDSLWKNKASKEQVIRAFGSRFKESHGGITYSFSGGGTIESGHFFNEPKHLVEQFIFLDESSLEDLKSRIPCGWNESKGFEAVGHTVYEVKRGKCSGRQISYEYKPGSDHYEVRWK